MGIVVTQPALDSDHGLILTIGGICNTQRWEIVCPMATNVAPNFNEDANELVKLMDSAPQLALLEACFSSDNHIDFFNCEGMVKGKFVPARLDFPPSANAGSNGAPATPMQVAGLGVYYVDPSQQLAGARERVAKNFFPGLDVADIVGNILIGTTLVAIENWCAQMANGITTAGGGPKTFFRVGKAIRAAGQALPNIVMAEVRNYLCTQKRRLTPRP